MTSVARREASRRPAIVRGWLDLGLLLVGVLVITVAASSYIGTGSPAQKQPCSARSTTIRSCRSSSSGQ
jgi:hypothetical protein